MFQLQRKVIIAVTAKGSSKVSDKRVSGDMIEHAKCWHPGYKSGPALFVAIFTDSRVSAGKTIYINK